MKIPDLKEEDITLLEKEIDKMNEILPPMKSFILPGGHPTVSHITYCPLYLQKSRTLLCKIEAEKNEVEPIIIKYLNRLSDYLFVLARYTGHLLKVEEIPWKPRI